MTTEKKMDTLTRDMNAGIDEIIARLQELKQLPGYRAKAWKAPEIADELNGWAGYWENKLENYLNSV